jgi:hypothetical protein
VKKWLIAFAGCEKKAGCFRRLRKKDFDIFDFGGCRRKPHDNSEPSVYSGIIIIK